MCNCFSLICLVISFIEVLRNVIKYQFHKTYLDNYSDMKHLDEFEHITNKFRHLNPLIPTES